MTYNILHGYLYVNKATFFTRAWMTVRGHSCKLLGYKEVGQNYFLHHVLSICNIVEAYSTNEFKKLFDNWNNDIMFSTDLL